MLTQNNTAIPNAVIFGCEGLSLTEKERQFFADANPLGFILFSRNIKDKAQVQSLVRDLRACVGRDNAPVLIDQEGGRVARLKAPVFRNAPAAGRFAALAKRDLTMAKEAVYLNASLMARELKELGITVDCAPVADLYIPGAHEIIGDRAYGEDPETVAVLAQAVCDGFEKEGIIPVIKHIPGHGRAKVDSHKSLPVVDAEKAELDQTDFKAFKPLKHAPWAMTAHIIYSAIDAERPATLSPDVIKLIREEIGFTGVLISDDLSMKALTGSFGDRTTQALNAGCDVVLHCNGHMKEMQEIANSVLPLTAEACKRIDASLNTSLPQEAVDVASLELRLDNILKTVA